MRLVKKRTLLRVKRFRPHPTCPDHCAEKLRGIVDNLRLTGEVPESFDVDIKVLSGVMWVPGGSYVAECEHGREFLILPTDESEAKRS